MDAGHEQVPRLTFDSGLKLRLENSDQAVAWEEHSILFLDILASTRALIFTMSVAAYLALLFA